MTNLYRQRRRPAAQSSEQSPQGQRDDIRHQWQAALRDTQGEGKRFDQSTTYTPSGDLTPKQPAQNEAVEKERLEQQQRDEDEIEQLSQAPLMPRNAKGSIRPDHDQPPQKPVQPPQHRSGPGSSSDHAPQNRPPSLPAAAPSAQSEPPQKREPTPKPDQKQPRKRNKMLTPALIGNATQKGSTSSENRPPVSENRQDSALRLSHYDESNDDSNFSTPNQSPRSSFQVPPAPSGLLTNYSNGLSVDPDDTTLNSPVTSDIGDRQLQMFQIGSYETPKGSPRQGQQTPSAPSGLLSSYRDGLSVDPNDQLLPQSMTHAADVDNVLRIRTDGIDIGDVLSGSISSKDINALKDQPSKQEVDRFDRRMVSAWRTNQTDRPAASTWKNTPAIPPAPMNPNEKNVIFGKVKTNIGGQTLPMPGQFVFVDTKGEGKFEKGMPFAVTDEDGKYAFTGEQGKGLISGQHQITIVENDLFSFKAQEVQRHGGSDVKQESVGRALSDSADLERFSPRVDLDPASRDDVHGHDLSSFVTKDGQPLDGSGVMIFVLDSEFQDDAIMLQENRDLNLTDMPEFANKYNGEAERERDDYVGRSYPTYSRHHPSKASHGTKVMSVIAGTNEKNQYGVAPGATVVPIKKFFGELETKVDTPIFSLDNAPEPYSAPQKQKYIDVFDDVADFAARNPDIPVILSWSGYMRNENDPDLDERAGSAINRLNEAGVVFVASGGNRVSKDEIGNTMFKDYSNVINVGANDSDHQPSYRSRFWPQGTTISDNSVYKEVAFERASKEVSLEAGTSYSAPMIASMSALLQQRAALEKGVLLRPEEVKSMMVVSADPFEAETRNAIIGMRVFAEETAGKTLHEPGPGHEINPTRLFKATTRLIDREDVVVAQNPPFGPAARVDFVAIPKRE